MTILNSSGTLLSLPEAAERIGDAEMKFFVSVLETFFEELIDVMRTCEGMIEPRGHSEICRMYLGFLTHRVPGSEIAIREVGLDAAVRDIPQEPAPRKIELGAGIRVIKIEVPQPSSFFRRKLVRFIPRALKISLVKLPWLDNLVMRFDEFIFPGSRSLAVSRHGAAQQKSQVEPTVGVDATVSDSANIEMVKPVPDVDPKPLHRFGRDDIAALARRLAESHRSSLFEGWALARRLDQEKRDVHIFVTHVFPTTWAPLVRALNEHDIHTVWCGIDDPREVDGYGVLETPMVGTTTRAILSLVGVLAFLCSIERCRIMMSGECFYDSNWNAESTTVLYSLVSSVMKTVRRMRPTKNNLNLIMYDGLKPINAAGSSENKAITYYYKRLMGLGDRIIYNSNTELLGSFNQYAIPITTPRIHFYRYSEAPVSPKPRIDIHGGRNIHLACITVSLGEFGEPSRDQVSNYVRGIIRSGIHFHYYCMTDHPAILKYKEGLGEYGGFLHLHPIIKDQTKLVEELHQYHAGFNPSDHVPFAHGIASLHDRFYQDGMSVFLQSTIGTSFLVYAAAGLPVLLPRGCVGAAQLLGDVAIPVIFSEMGNLRSLLQDCGLERRLALADANRANVHIGTHIERYLDFLRSDGS